VVARSRAAVAVLAAFAGVCVSQAAVSQAGDPAWTHSTKVRMVTDPRINEDSGLTRSTYPRTTLFVHNDSGDTARFFALSKTGSTAAVFNLPSAPSLDWEDTASGPDHTLWFGDIGDNQTRKAFISVIRVTEPRDLHSRNLGSTTYKLQYPNGPHDAEALMVRPNSGQLYVITKDANGGTIYRAPKTLKWGVMNQLTPVASAPATVTGADFSPNGKQFVLRTYSTAYLYFRIGGAPKSIKLPSHGESIGFNRAGDALLIGSEGLNQPIWRIDR
jgi:hypothetical protein